MYFVKSTKGYDLFISGGEIVIDITYYGIKGVLSKKSNYFIYQKCTAKIINCTIKSISSSFLKTRRYA